MKSITIHGLEDRLDARIREKASQQGLSLNKTIKKLLAESLGLEEPSAPRDYRKTYEDLCGIWTREEAAAFKRRTEDFNRVDPGDWE
jgi:hypothetical protein